MINYKKILPFLVLCIFVLTACNQSAYKEAMNRGEAAVDNGDFEAALDYFTTAYEEKESEELQTILEQAQYIVDAEEGLKDEDIEEQIQHYQELAALDGGLESLQVAGQERLDHLEATVQTLAEMEALQEAGNHEALIKEIDAFAQQEETQAWTVPMDDQFVALKEEAQIAQLFSYIEGYGEKEKRPGKEEDDLDQFCQISQDDIACTILITDIGAYREIVAIHLENDNSLRIETNRKDREDLIFSNITDGSYEIDGQKYQHLSKEEMEAAARTASDYYSTLDDIFNVELIKELEDYHFSIDYFQEQSENVEETVGAEGVLNGYSGEEIEFAKVWLDYKGDREIAAIVEFWEKGRPISIPFEENSAVFLEDVVSISSEIPADGKIVYSSNGDGTINVYDIPYRWPAEYEMEGGVQAYTSKIATSPEKRSVPEGDLIELLNVLEWMTVVR